MIKKIISAVLFTLVLTNAGAQRATLQSRLFDTNKQAIDAATIVLLHANDSSYVASTLSDSLGFFKVEGAVGERYFIQVQHLAYEKLSIPVSFGTSVLPDSFFLKNNATNIKEVSVTGRRPAVKMIDNRLIYDVSQINKLRTEETAFGSLKNIPGIFIQDDNVRLVGSSKVNLMINGQQTTLSTENIIAMLKSTLASRVKEVQVMYSAPPQYNVTGALINVVLKDNKSEAPLMQGEVKLGVTQRSYLGENVNANLFYSSAKLDMELMYSGSSDKRKNDLDLSIKHQFKGTEYDITQDAKNTANTKDHLAQLSAKYKLDNKDALSFAYTLNYTDGKTNGKTLSSFSSNALKSNSQTDNTSTKQIYLHNAKFQFNSHAAFNVGVDYTFYKDPSEQAFSETDNASATKFITQSGQKINKGLFFANASNTLWSGTLNYGLNASLSHNQNNYSYTQLQAGNFKPDTADMKNTRIEELTVTPFVGYAKDLSEKLSVQFGLKGEYYTMKDKSGATDKTLWDRMDMYPNANVSYTFSAKHIVQLSFESYTTYPTYWAINPVTMYQSSYTFIAGNRYLTPSRTYSTQLNYIVNQKYVVTSYYERTNDYLIQMPYQRTDALNLVYRYENVDNFSLFGVAFTLPFNIGTVVDSKAVLNVFRMIEKDNNYYDIAYNRACNSFDVMLNNSITISKKPSIKLDLSGYYTYNRIQGIYDLGSTYDVSSGIKWTFADGRASLQAKVSDLFKTNLPDIKVRYRSQYSNQAVDQDTRLYSVSFSYRFGGYNKNSQINVDKARFSRN